MMITAYIVQRDQKLKPREDYIISQDADQWGNSNIMNRAANMLIKDE